MLYRPAADKHYPSERQNLLPVRVHLGSVTFNGFTVVLHLVELAGLP